MTTSGDEQALEPERQAALKLLLGNLPESYPERYAALLKIRHAFHREMADVLEPALNHHVARKPQESPLERQELSAWINQQLRDIGLSVQDPKTKQPASLTAVRQFADDPEYTVFRFSIRTETGSSLPLRKSRDLPYLYLTEHAPRIESRAKFYRRKPPESLQR